MQGIREHKAGLEFLEAEMVRLCLSTAAAMWNKGNGWQNSGSLGLGAFAQYRTVL